MTAMLPIGWLWRSTMARDYKNSEAAFEAYFAHSSLVQKGQ